jgi:hypothetical protein
MADESQKESVVLKTLATIERPGWGDKKAEQLRIEVCSFNGGNPYISARVWWQPEDGTWAPGKKGITFRNKELDTIQAALMAGAEFIWKRPAEAKPDTKAEHNAKHLAGAATDEIHF